MPLSLYNTLSRQTEVFLPLDPQVIRMYVCGPTVYDRPHIGNARAVVVYDVLFRILQHLYPQVMYVRNITDVDDKINAAARARNESIQHLTQRITQEFHLDMRELGNLPPTLEPKATEHIDEMIFLIQQLLQKRHAYEREGHVFFSVKSDPHYGKLSGRTLEEMIAGARVEISELKQHPADFVLWKPADQEDDPSAQFSSPWGWGRPGWHIECSAMSTKYLGENFDIHGGGADLMFPHHTNEIAQSCCAFPGSLFAQYWVHNGFVTVQGTKMSKSLGNFITVRELLEQGIAGEVIRYVLLSTHYRKPLDWNEKAVQDAQKALDNFYRTLGESEDMTLFSDPLLQAPESFLHTLKQDLNTPEALTFLHGITKQIHKTANPQEKQQLTCQLFKAGQMIGFFNHHPSEWFQKNQTNSEEIDAFIAARKQAKLQKNYAESDRIRNLLLKQGIILEDKPDGTTQWRRE